MKPRSGRQARVARKQDREAEALEKGEEGRQGVCASPHDAREKTDRSREKGQGRTNEKRKLEAMEVVGDMCSCTTRVCVCVERWCRRCGHRQWLVCGVAIARLTARLGGFMVKWLSSRAVFGWRQLAVELAFTPPVDHTRRWNANRDKRPRPPPLRAGAHLARVLRDCAWAVFGQDQLNPVPVLALRRCGAKSRFLAGIITAVIWT